MLIVLARLMEDLTVRAQEGMSISPLHLTLEAKPGETIHAVIDIKNKGAKSITVRALVRDFVAEDGTMQLSFAPPTSNNSLASWITISNESIALSPGETKEIFSTITVPQNAEPGDHYTAVLVGTFPETTGEGGTMVVVGSAVSSLVILRVAGTVIEKATIEEFRSTQGFYTDLPFDFIIWIRNTGNVRLKPVGTIEVYDWRNNKVSEISVNEASNIIFPNSTRSFEASWTDGSAVQPRFLMFQLPPLLLGKYKAVVTMEYGDVTATKLVFETGFWVVSWKWVTILVGLACLSIVLWQLRKRGKISITWTHRKKTG